MKVGGGVGLVGRVVPVTVVVALVASYTSDEVMLSDGTSMDGCGCIVFNDRSSNSERLSSVVVTIRGRVTRAGLGILSASGVSGMLRYSSDVLAPGVRIASRG